MPPVTAVATAAARLLSSSPSFASISTLSIHLGLSLFLFPSPAKLREPSAFSFRLTPLLRRAYSLAHPLRTPPESPPPPTDPPPLSPESLNGVAEPPEPAINPTPSFSSLFLVPATSRLGSRSHFSNDRLPPPFPLLIPVVSKREQRWRKTKQLSEGARNSRSPFYRDEIDPRAHRRGMLDPFCRVSTRRHPSRGWVGAENEGEQAVVAVSAVRGHSRYVFFFLSPDYFLRHRRLWSILTFYDEKCSLRVKT